MSQPIQASFATSPPATAARGRRAARFLAFLFTTLAWVAGAAAPLVAEPPLPFLYFADGSSQPGSVIRYDQTAGTETALYKRPAGRLSGFAFAPWDPNRLYFVNANDRKIFEVSLARGGPGTESVVFTHSTFVRNIAFDAAGRLYFSEATGGGGNGKIWRLDGGTASLYGDVLLAKIGGFWAGDFAFAPDGSLLVSSGNVVGARLYKLDVATGFVTKLYQAPATEALTGFVADADGVLYLTNQAKRIYRLNLTLGGTATVIADRPLHQTINAVGLRPSAAPPQVVPAGTWVMPFGIGDISANRIKASGLVDYGSIKDAPFGSNLAFRLDASNAVPTTRVFYYRYRYRRHGTLGWTDFEAPVSVHYVQNRPGKTPIFPTVKLGPTAINGMNLYRFRPHDPGEIVPPTTGTLEWPKVPFPGDLSGSFLDTVSLTPVPGLYDVRLEIYSNAGALTPPGPDYQMIVPSGVDAEGTLLTKPAAVVAGGYELTLFVDNRHAEAEIAAPSIGATAADGCGFLRYPPAAPGEVRLGWHAWHPGKFAVYSFSIIRGASSLGTLPLPAPAPALTLPINDEVASSLHHPDGAGNFFELSPTTGLLGGCQEAAFAARLNVAAKATNGYDRIGAYDASATRAFAVAPKK